MPRPRSVAGWTVAAFGATALLSGIVAVASPDLMLRLIGSTVPARRAAGDHTPAFVLAAGMASVNMGVYYLLAAAKDWRPFFAFTAFFRMVTVVVFTTAVLAGRAPAGFLGVAA